MLFLVGFGRLFHLTWAFFLFEEKLITEQKPIAFRTDTGVLNVRGDFGLDLELMYLNDSLLYLSQFLFKSSFGTVSV